MGLLSQPVEWDLAKGSCIRRQGIGVTVRVMRGTWLEMSALLESGKLGPTPVITHKLPMADFQEAIALAKSGQAGKIPLSP